MPNFPIEKHPGYDADFEENNLPELEHDIIGTKLFLSPISALQIGSVFPKDPRKSNIGLYELEHYVPSHNHTYNIYYFYTGSLPFEFLRITPVKLVITGVMLTRLLVACKTIHEMNIKAEGDSG
jgi:hypothetical protein